jgi:hypothetical protein
MRGNKEKEIQSLMTEARDNLQRAVTLGKATDRGNLTPSELAIHDTLTAEAERKLKLFDNDPIQFMNEIRREISENQ